MKRLLSKPRNAAPSSPADDPLPDPLNADCRVLVNGLDVPAVSGRTVAATLHAQGILAWRTNAVDGSPRGPFCGMGICRECIVTVEGMDEQRACLLMVKDGLRIGTES